MPAAFPGNSTTKLARAATGGGFESAIEAPTGALSVTQLDGDTLHGSRIAVSTDGTYDFGTKFQGPPVWWLMGDELYVNGVKDTGPEALLEGDPLGYYGNTGSLSPISRARATRHANSNLVVHNPTDANSAIYSNYGALLENGRPNSIFVSWWARYPFPTDEVTLYEIAGITGTPVLGDRNMDGNGEEFYLKNSGSTDPVGRFIGVHDGTDGQSVPAQAGTYGKWLKFRRYSLTLATRGETFVGITSGAEVDMQPEVSAGSPLFIGDGSTKHGRINTSPRADGVDQVRHVASHRREGSTCFVYDDINGNLYNVENEHAEASYPWDRTSPFPLWANPVISLDATGRVDPDYFVDHHYYDFGKTPDVSGYKRAVFESSKIDVADGFIPLSRIDATQMCIPQVMGISLGYDHMYDHDMGEMVIDYEPHRVVIADADTWANVTRTEIQRTISWSQTSVEVAINRGAVGSGWLYVLDSVDTPVNSQGVAI